MIRSGSRSGPPSRISTWSSPSIGEVNGRRLIYFGGGDGVMYAFEALKQIPANGEVQRLKKVWSFNCDPDGPKVILPVPGWGSWLSPARSGGWTHRYGGSGASPSYRSRTGPGHAAATAPR